MLRRMAKLDWFKIKEEWHHPSLPQGYTYVARIDAGWLVSVWAGTDKNQKWGGGLTFVPDPDHKWKVEVEDSVGPDGLPVT